MPPVSRDQQKLVFARARAGERWAKRWIAEGSMKVKHKGAVHRLAAHRVKHHKRKHHRKGRRNGRSY